MSRWSSAHQLVFQGLCPEWLGRSEAPDRFEGGKGARPDAGQPGRQPGDDGARGTVHGSRDRYGGRESVVGPVQQPGHRKRGEYMDGRHRAGRLMPVGSAHRGGRSLRAGGVCEVTAPGACRTVRQGQRHVQQPLDTERAAERRHGRETPSSGRPGRRELRENEQRHRAPWGDPVGHRVVARQREHTAGHGEHRGSHAGSRPVRPLRVTVPAGRRRIVARHVRASFSADRHGPSVAHTGLAATAFTRHDNRDSHPRGSADGLRGTRSSHRARPGSRHVAGAQPDGRAVTAGALGHPVEPAPTAGRWCRPVRRTGCRSSSAGRRGRGGG